MNEGLNALARVLQNRMNEMIDSRGPTFDFGTIQEDMSLLQDGFPCPIPKGEYMVCRNIGKAVLSSLYPKIHLAETGYEIEQQEIEFNLLPGHRVLVAWVKNECVIVDVVGKLLD